MPYHIRMLDMNSDLHRIVKLVNTVNLEPMTVEAFQAQNCFTGVLRPYRGRHIALALKLLSISAARNYNIDYLYTNNDSTNAPMLAINRRLGYQEYPGIIMLIQTL